MAAFLLVWVNAAVGIFGDEDDLANAMYVGVIAVGIIGAIIARLQPHGMARALCATALAQALVAAIALLAGMHHTVPGFWVRDLVLMASSSRCGSYQLCCFEAQAPRARVKPTA